MNAIQLYEHNVANEIKDVITKQQEGLYYLVPEKTVAFVGYRQSALDFILDKYKVTKLELNNEGGIIVSETGSIGIAYFSKDVNNKFNQSFASLFAEYLRNKGINVVFEGNDLLVDGIYKVASYSSRRFGNLLFSAFHISYKVNLKLIELICTKPMDKIPKGLNEYGISKEEILNFFLSNYIKAL